ncbi:MAG: serine hydrolase domain-containing protein [Melioribacteraceae bacterium]
MKTILLSFVALFGMTIPSVCQSQDLLNDSTSRQLKIVVEGFKNRYHSPSIVVVIVHDKTIIFSESEGYTDVNNKIQATIDSKYPILSVTKPFTATMFMQLYQKNIVALDDDVKKYVPEFKGSSNLADKSGTTLLQLATHTSGLPRNSPADINFTKQVDKWILTGAKDSVIEAATKREFLNSLQFVEVEYPKYQLLPYGNRHYSNLGYSLLGIALERAAKKDYATYIVNNICKPLKLNNTGFVTENTGKNSLAKGYYYDDSNRTFIETPLFKPNSALYNGGMYSTARDLAKFISFQFEKNSVETNKFLSDDNKTMMQAFNIGWKSSYPFVTHEGAMLGYRCEIIFNPKIKIGWVILTNTTDFDFSRINDNISRLILPIFNKNIPMNLRKYEGVYKLTGGYDSLKIFTRNDSLYSSYLHGMLPESPLSHLGENKFRGQGKGNYSIGYDFILGDNSEIKFLNMGQLMWVRQ